MSASFIISFLSLLLPAAIVAVVVFIYISNKSFKHSRGAGFVVGGMVFLVMVLFFSYPLAKRIEQDAKKKVQWIEEVDKEIIKECLQEYAEENSLVLSEEKAVELADYVFEKRLYVSTEDVFYVKDRFLDDMKVLLPSKQ